MFLFYDVFSREYGYVLIKALEFGVENQREKRRQKRQQEAC